MLRRIQRIEKRPDPQGGLPADEPVPGPWWRGIPFHPFLAAAFPVLTFYANNIGELDPRDAWRPLLASVAGTLTAWLALGVVSRSIRKGAAASSMLVLMFFSYGHLLDLAPGTLRPFVAPGILILLAGLLAVTVSCRGHLIHGTTALNLAGLVLVVPSCWAIGSNTYVTTAAERPIDQFQVSGHRMIPPAAPDAPDVYYIILDAYGRADRLKQFYGVDNEPFLKELRKRGFYIADRSMSNYDQTVLSLASSLNMSYLDDLVHQVGTRSADTELARQMLDDNAVARFLRPLGYHYVAIGSGTGQVRITEADLKLHLQARVSSAERKLLGTTLLGRTPSVRDNDYDMRREYIRTAFRYLRSVTRLPYAKFVFAHISAPHPPFLFGPNGEARNPSWTQGGEDGSWLLQHISAEEYRRGYAAQLSYVNKQVLKSIDTILRGSRCPPIIILQGDHGPRLHLDWDSLAKTDLREPFSVLNAYLVPQSVRARLYDTITPVNTFRVLLTHRFGGSFPPLPDQAYYSTIGRPYDFVEVTERAAYQ